jgi:hypothetical protein
MGGRTLNVGGTLEGFGVISNVASAFMSAALLSASRDGEQRIDPDGGGDDRPIDDEES